MDRFTLWWVMGFAAVMMAMALIAASDATQAKATIRNICAEAVQQNKFITYCEDDFKTYSPYFRSAK